MLYAGVFVYSECGLWWGRWCQTDSWQLTSPACMKPPWINDVGGTRTLEYLEDDDVKWTHDNFREYWTTNVLLAHKKVSLFVQLSEWLRWTNAYLHVHVYLHSSNHISMHMYINPGLHPSHHLPSIPPSILPSIFPSMQPSIDPSFYPLIHPTYHTNFREYLTTNVLLAHKRYVAH